MNEASSPDRDALEPLLAEALAALENGGDPELERFLADHPEAAAVLREALGELRKADLLHPPAAEVPRQLGEFRIREVLGEGGMGIVYLAEQTSLGREVALKVVRPELLFFDGARERFRREIDAVAKLEHPAIVPILATGIADGIPFYAMPRIRGRSAEAVVKELASRDLGTLRGSDLREALAEAGDTAPDTDGTFANTWWRAVVQLVRKAALGIQHAHARGVLHRDIKPSNLMLTADSRAIVLDFGLAHGGGDQSLTRTGSTLGSPAYMAPEQVRGEPACERTDVYGLAATMHCLLTLRPPFPATDPEALRGQILAGVQNARHSRAALPTELRLVLDTAMDVERGRRYATAHAFADDLHAVLEGRPILARRLPVLVRVRRFAARHRALTTLATAVVAFLVVLPTVLLWQQHAANLRLAAEARRSDDSVRLCVTAVEKLLGTVGTYRLRHLPAAQDLTAGMLREALSLFDQLATDEAQRKTVRFLRIRTLTQLALVEQSRGRVDEAITIAQRASDLGGNDDVEPEIRMERVAARRTLVGLWLDADRAADAEAMVGIIVTDLDALTGDPAFTEAVRTEKAHLTRYAASFAKLRGDPVATEAALRVCVNAYDETKERLAAASARLRLAQFLRDQRRFDEAHACAAAALQITLAPDLPASSQPSPRRVEASARRELAEISVQLGRTADAVTEFRAALLAFDRSLADCPDEVAALMGRGATANDLALIHLQRGERSEARPLLEGACRDQLAVLERNPKNEQAQRCLASHRMSLGRCLRELGDLTALETVARELGAMRGGSRGTLAAARNLLRCAAAVEPTERARAKALHAEALELLIETRRRNGQVTRDDPLYAPLRNDPRFLAIASVKGDVVDDGK